jgi:hypothetical protein
MPSPLKAALEAPHSKSALAMASLLIHIAKWGTISGARNSF